MDKWDPGHAAWLSRERRHAVELDATVDRDGAEQDSRVSDLSLDGCSLSGFFRIGEHLKVRIDGVGEFEAQIRWAFAGKAGARFLRKGAKAKRPLAADASGVAAIEYALLAALIALAIVGALTRTGAEVSSEWNQVDTALPGGTHFEAS